ncbi:MAG: cytochrome c oxidase assembly protein [Ilumatobacteraceae bacterium]
MDPWRYQAHPEVWLLMVSLIVAYVYMVRAIGPKAVPHGERAVTGRQLVAFTGGMALLWFASDWPVHDIGEEYLYSVHMFQHMVFAYFVPPLLLLALPEWMARTLIGTGRTLRVTSWLAKPVVAGLIFNGIVMITHIPGVVNASTTNGPLHYSLHFLVVTSALLMWTPVVGPIKEWQMGPGGKCIYLFLMSVVPTVPAGWLTFAEGVVYKHYRQPVRVWGLSVTDDQQLAGAIMKLGGAVYLWAITIFLFFKRFSTGFDADNTYVRRQRIPDAEITGNSERELTFGDVAAAFERSEPPASLEPEHAPRDER